MSTRWKNGVGKRCNCPNRPRCECLYSLRYQYKRTREIVSVKDVSFLLDSHEQIPTTREGAEELWRRWVTWIAKGKPDMTPAKPSTALTVAELIDRWNDEAKPFSSTGKRKSVVLNWNSKFKIAKAELGSMAVLDLTKKAIQAWVDEQTGRGLSLTRPHQLLATIVRPAALWGLAQQPPLLTGNPFGKYGYKIDRDKEQRRTGRIDPALEYELLDICELLNVAEHNFAGGVLADYIVMAIDTGGRPPSEYLELINASIDWHAHLLLFQHTKRSQPRKVPFNPMGRVAAILQRRRFAGSAAPILARPEGTAAKTLWKTWVHVVCILKGIPYVATREGVSKETTAEYQRYKLVPYLTRHEASTWWGLKGVTDSSAKFLQGHASQYDIHGRYKHEQLRIATEELRTKVWPFENERASRTVAVNQ